MAPLLGATLACLLLLVAGGCETATPPAAPQGETASPKDSPTSYKVLKDELNNGTVEYHVLVAEGLKHDDADALTKYLYRHLMGRREDPPAGVAAYVYTTEAAFSTPPRTPVASVVKRPSDLGPAFDNKVPLEFYQEIDQALGPRRDQGWKLAMKVTRDDAAKTVSVTVPYTEPGVDQWAESLSFNQALQVFTDVARALFKEVPDLKALTYSGVWKDKEVVHVVLTRADYNAVKLDEIDERIGQHHGRIFLALQTGKEAKQAPEKANAAASKENAALIAKEYKAMLAQLKGKATVAPGLR